MVENNITEMFAERLRAHLQLCPSAHLNEKTKSLFGDYFELLSKWNKTHNLISVTDVDALVSEHYLDCVLALNLWLPSLTSKAPIFDLGSGNGFPGLIAAVMEPSRTFVLVESLRKKCSFLRAAKAGLGLSHVSVNQDRVENLHSIEVAITRAAFSDNMINDLARAFAPNGILALMRVPSANFGAVVENGPWMVVDQLNYTLDTGAERCVVVLRKKNGST
jgi:16S rRNA (guanine(527)-N(7))-methyltransferase RsmG